MTATQLIGAHLKPIPGANALTLAPIPAATFCLDCWQKDGILAPFIPAENGQACERCQKPREVTPPAAGIAD